MTYITCHSNSLPTLRDDIANSKCCTWVGHDAFTFWSDLSHGDITIVVLATTAEIFKSQTEIGLFILQFLYSYEKYCYFIV